MDRIKHSAVAIIFCFCKIAAKDFPTPLGTFKYNCFLDKAENECESAIAQWDGIYYACEMVINLDFTIQAIGLVDNQTLVYAGNSLTYAINETKEEAKVVEKIIPPFENLVDINNNTYFLANGSNYVLLNETGKVKEIKAGSKNYNQLATNADGKILYILNPKENETKNSNNRGGDLYILRLVPFDIITDSIEARLDTSRKHITAISTLNGKLLLGLRTVNDTGKLIRLIRIPVYSNPCDINIGEHIRSLEMSYVELLARSCEKHISHLAASSPFYNDTLNSMTADNIALKVKLDEAERCEIPENLNSQLTEFGLRPTQNIRDDIEIGFNFPLKLRNTNKGGGEVEECPPAYRIQLENGNLKARLKFTTNTLVNLLSSIDALNREFGEKPIPTAEEEETYEEGYWMPKKCLEAFQLDALTDNIERLEQVELNLRQKLLEYTKESKSIVSEVNPSTEDEEYEK